MAATSASGTRSHVACFPSNPDVSASFNSATVIVKAFTPEQTEWLRLMKEHIASSCAIHRDDFDYAALADKGGLQKAWGLFGKELDGLMDEMNWELVA